MTPKQVEDFGKELAVQATHIANGMGISLEDIHINVTCRVMSTEKIKITYAEGMGLMDQRERD